MNLYLEEEVQKQTQIQRNIYCQMEGGMGGWVEKVERI